MTESQILTFARQEYGAIFIAAAAQFAHRPEVLAGIVARESQAGLSPLLDRQGPEGRGDKQIIATPDGGQRIVYHGHGLCQIDDRSFPEFCAGEDWKSASKNIFKAAEILRNKRRYLAAKTLGMQLTVDDLERATIAAYNCGEGREERAIRAGLGFDYYTAGGDYSSDVLRLADIYVRLAAEASA